MVKNFPIVLKCRGKLHLAPKEQKLNKSQYYAFCFVYEQAHTLDMAKCNHYAGNKPLPLAPLYLIY